MKKKYKKFTAARHLNGIQKINHRLALVQIREERATSRSESLSWRWSNDRNSGDNNVDLKYIYICVYTIMLISEEFFVISVFV